MLFCKSERHHTCCHAVNRFYCSGLLAGVGGSRRAADVPGYRDLSPPPPAQPEALAHCSCLVGEKVGSLRSASPPAGELLISLPIEQQLQELKTKWLE